MPTQKDAILDRLRRQRDDEETLDADAIRQEWVTALQALMEQLRAWLSEAEGEELIRVRDDLVVLKEERLGSYRVPELRLMTPKRESLRIVPRARFVVGGYGRVDFRCTPRSSILVRTELDRWQFAHLVPESRGWVYEDLTEESFWQTLGELLS